MQTEDGQNVKGYPCTPCIVGTWKDVYDSEKILRNNADANNALQNQATLDNIFINTKYFKDGKYALPCRNCQVTFEGCLFPKQ